MQRLKANLGIKSRIGTGYQKFQFSFSLMKEIYAGETNLRLILDNLEKQTQHFWDTLLIVLQWTYHFFFY